MLTSHWMLAALGREGDLVLALAISIGVLTVERDPESRILRAALGSPS